MPLKIVHNDITNMDVDVIVNAANSHLLAGGGVCGAIFNKAGIKDLQDACDKLSPVYTGEAVITPGFQLKARFIIHAVGPIYKDGRHHEEELLSNAYMNSLELASDYKCQSIAFPLISSGIYGYPKDEALLVATNTISKFLMNHDIDVYLVVFDKQAVKLSEKLYTDIEHYIDEYYYEEPYSSQYFESIRCLKASSLDDVVNDLDESFSETLFKFINHKHMSDVEVYKRANIDHKLFFKMRNTHYHPNKKTVLALSVALYLSIDETEELLDKAGYSLSNSQKVDVIVKYFIENKDYDLFKINNALFCFELPILS